jgi:cytoskeletal protein RodZ
MATTAILPKDRTACSRGRYNQNTKCSMRMRTRCLQINRIMKNLQHLLLVFLLLFAITSCKESTEKTKDNTNKVEDTRENKSVEVKSNTNTTYLCKINGEDWSYTKASGIVSRHKKTKKRTAIITFTKKLDKGKETVQLFYDGDTYQLEKVSIHLKQPKKDGGEMTAMYQLLIEGGRRLPDSNISGTLDLSNPTTVSGTANVKNMKMLFEEEQLEDKTMTVITLTPLSFDGIGYSELNKRNHGN